MSDRRAILKSMSGPTWEPITEADLRQAEQSGILDEAIVGVEFKQQLSDNKKTAKELASLALYGGALLVGVVDPKNRNGDESALVPFEFEGVPERIENIASAHGITAHPRVIPSGRNAAEGYIWVEVPTSPRAPHMVDGKYWGRSGGSCRALTDDEVRLHLRRQMEREDIAESALKEFASRYLGSGEDSVCLNLVLVPETPRGRMAQECLDRQHTGRVKELRARIEYSNPYCEIGSRYRVSGAYAFSGHELEAGQPVWGSDLFEVLEISEAGKIGFHWRCKVDDAGDGGRFVSPERIAGSVRATISLAGELAMEFQYSGSWSLALRVSGLKNCKASVQNTDPYWLPAFSGTTYSGRSLAMSRGLREEAGANTFELCGQLMRDLGVETVERIRQYFVEAADDSID